MSKDYLRPKKVLITRRNNAEGFQFPEVPEGYNPKSSSREVNLDDEKDTVVEIDGFKIINERQDELPFNSATTDLANGSQYKKRNVYCDICKVVFTVIGDSVIHVHETHDYITGNEQNVRNGASDIIDNTVEDKRKQ